VPESLMRRHVAILLKFTQSTEHPHLQTGLENYAKLLQAMGMNDADVLKRLKDLQV
jgi:hypothetical protein